MPAPDSRLAQRQPTIARSALSAIRRYESSFKGSAPKPRNERSLPRRAQHSTRALLPLVRYLNQKRIEITFSMSNSVQPERHPYAGAMVRHS
jgi:hypothetical protein